MSKKCDSCGGIAYFKRFYPNGEARHYCPDHNPRDGRSVLLDVD